MKTYLLLLACLLTFASCTQLITEPATEPADTVVVIEDPMDDYVMPEDYTKSEMISEETDMYIIEYKYPQFDGTDTLNDMILSQVVEEVDLFKVQIEDFEATDIEEMKSGLYSDYTIYLNDFETLSIGYENYMYFEGTAHGTSYTTVFNFDYDSFEMIDMYQLFNPDTNWIMAMSALTIPKLKLMLNDDEFADDEWIEEGAGDDSMNFERFTITEEGIIIHFDPYQVAVYAAGPQKVELTFNELYALLAPQWASKAITDAF